MANVCQCDNCKKIIEENDIKINLIGYNVTQNLKSSKMPKGYEIKIPQDFCSFNCLSEWALKEQETLDEYKELAKKYEDNNDVGE